MIRGGGDQHTRTDKVMLETKVRKKQFSSTDPDLGVNEKQGRTDSSPTVSQRWKRPFSPAALN